MRFRFALLTLVLVVPALAGCGGGGDGSSSTAASTAERTVTTQSTGEEKQQAAAKPKPPRQPKRQSAAEGDPTPGAKAVAPDVPVVKGSDNSIQEFGTEGEADPREQATATLRAYLSALGAGEWERACAQASTEFSQDLVKLLGQAQGIEKPQDCTAALALLGAKAPEAALRVPPPEEALSFRVEGEHAYLIYRDAKGAAMFIAMADDDGQWKVNVLTPEPFSEPTQGSSQ